MALNLLFNGERLCFAFEYKDPFVCKATSSNSGNGSSRSMFSRKKKMRYHGCGRICSLGKKASGFTGNELQLCVSHDGDYDYDEDVVEFERDELSCFRGLVLDISYRPINVVCWKRAICLEFMDKADVLEYYDQTVNSPSGSFNIPAVLRVPNLLQVVKRRRIRQHLSRKNIFFRDAFICQYCSSRESLTVDHVLPISRGGEWEWENLVTACAKCNSRKGQKTLEEANMKLIQVPKAPKDSDIVAIPLTAAALKTLRKRKGLPNEWCQYLGIPSSKKKVIIEVNHSKYNLKNTDTMTKSCFGKVYEHQDQIILWLGDLAKPVYSYKINVLFYTNWRTRSLYIYSPTFLVSFRSARVYCLWDGKSCVSFAGIGTLTTSYTATGFGRRIWN
ncbi:hypothetical protein IFM89_008579 [Coptis chinensis]|uniref:HNH nuclease domain-containing protein n=1 Tax=Coptis chinensis TaxID=261450 RepID=A0A835I095_9MAGN|nr:hypothetical protein IFM89_008579 [Coptis chinensis]